MIPGEEHEKKRLSTGIIVLLAALGMAMSVFPLWYGWHKGAPRRAAVGHVNAGIALAKQEKYDEAVAEYNAATTADPKFFLAYYNRGNSYEHQRNYKQALADYSQCVALDPKNAHAYVARASPEAALEQYDQALSDCNEAIRLDPKLAHAYLTRGILWTRLEKYDQAIVDYSQAMILGPKTEHALAYRGGAYLYLGQLEKASADANASIQINPKQSYAYAIRGALLLERGELDGAITAYTKSIENGESTCYASRGYAFYLMGDKSSALIDYSRALEAGKVPAYAHLQRGRIFREQGDDARAQIEFAAAENLPKKQYGHVREHAYAMAALGKYDDAIKECEENIAAHPWDRWSPYMLACIYCLRAKSRSDDDEGKKLRAADLDIALKHLEIACKRGLDKWPQLKSAPELKTLNGDPRYGALQPAEKNKP